MSDKYGECYCGDCISFNKCRSDKGTRINLVSEGCSCFEPNDIAEFDYPLLPKWLAEHDSELLNRCSMTFKSIIHNRHGQISSETERELFADINTFIAGMKAEVNKNADEP